MNSNEIEIPVPWGIIAAKTWGNSTDPLILCGHGWTDNANSFDPIIPYLPKCYYYVCIDLPGHGKSTPFNSPVVQATDYVIPLKLVYNFFNRKKLTILAHSLSGCATVLFAQIYSDCVEKIIIIDVLYFHLASANRAFECMIQTYHARINCLEKDRNAASFTKEEIIQRQMNNRISWLSRKSAEVLVERKVEPVADGKFRITLADNVRQLMFTYFTPDAAADAIRNFPIKCPHLIILSSKSRFMLLGYKDLVNEFKKNPNFEMHLVAGTHDVILEKPETVAPLVCNFLLKHQSKL